MSDTKLPYSIKTPGKANMLGEMLTPTRLAFSLMHAPALLGAPKGDGHPVLLAPGYLAPEMSMTPLKVFLSTLGYRTYHWGQGTNRGDVDPSVLKLGERVQEISRDTGKDVSLIGWSLGGVMVREVARLFPESVRQVITLGTPILGGPKYTTVGDVYSEAYDLDMDAFELEVHERNSQGLSQPITSIFSKTDGIVAWEASVDTYNPQAQNIEVRSTHLGLGVHPKVWRIVADRLSEAPPK